MKHKFGIAVGIVLIALLGTALAPRSEALAQAPCGTFATQPAFSSGNPQLAQVVFNCGTAAQLDAALRSVGATGVWAQSSTGMFHVYIVGAPSFANAPFLTAFPSGFAGLVALTLVKTPAAVSTCAAYSFSVGDPVGTPGLPPFVCIDTPLAGDQLSGTVTVSGFSGGAFENALVIDALDAFDQLIVRQPVTVSAPDVGRVGSYSAALTLPAATLGAGRIVVFATSPMDGSVAFSDEVNVTFGP